MHTATCRPGEQLTFQCGDVNSPGERREKKERKKNRIKCGGGNRIARAVVSKRCAFPRATKPAERALGRGSIGRRIQSSFRSCAARALLRWPG
ncbi:Protein of unknown function [Gryllus bimaculatus]|nr:Protein of unknown function [Gryllus bimaculatus]